MTQKSFNRWLGETLRHICAARTWCVWWWSSWSNFSSQAKRTSLNGALRINFSHHPFGATRVRWINDDKVVVNYAGRRCRDETIRFRLIDGMKLEKICRAEIINETFSLLLPNAAMTVFVVHVESLKATSLIHAGKFNKNSTTTTSTTEAPSELSQKDLIKEILESSSVEPEEVSENVELRLSGRLHTTQVDVE